MSGEANSYQGGESGSYQGGGQVQYGNHQPDAQEAARYAKQHYGDDDGDETTSVFHSVLSKFSDQGGDASQHHLNETEAEHAAHAHEKIYTQNAGEPVQGQSSRDLGSAAAMQAFKMFSGGGGGGGSSGGSSSQLVGMAMGEAMKLFNKQGGSQGGANQGEMLQSAAMMAMKLFAAQKGSSSSSGLEGLMGVFGGAGGQEKQSGGGAMSLLSKFL